jgi:hypothetical protein
MTITHLHDIAYHRNGISGAPFHVVLFDDAGDEASRKVAIVFDESHHVAVLDVAKLHAGNVRFGENSWRGDVYETQLRQFIQQYNHKGD